MKAINVEDRSLLALNNVLLFISLSGLCNQYLQIWLYLTTNKKGINKEIVNRREKDNTTLCRFISFKQLLEWKRIPLKILLSACCQKQAQFYYCVSLLCVARGTGQHLMTGMRNL